SFGGAVAGEAWFRLGLMTLLLTLLQQIRREGSLADGWYWPVIVRCAGLSGVAHIPQLLAYQAASSFAVLGTVIGNCAVGSLYGWCFWRQGLMTAMLAHFTVDIGLHVVPAFFI